MIFKNLRNKQQSGETKKSEDKRSTSTRKLNGWLLTFTFLFLASITITIGIPIIIWSEYLFEQNESTNGKCSYNYQNGVCLANSYCCDGQYVIGSGLCSGSALCCLGDAKQCNDPLDNETMWSFESITTITSLVVARNVSEPIVEQAIVIAVSAVEGNVYYSDVSEIVGKELSATTGQQWLAIVGDRKTFEIFLQQFRGYIVITIKDIEIVLVLTNQSRSGNCDQTMTDNNDNQTDNQFGVDTLPAIDILRNEIVDKTAQTFITQTIDYVLHSCVDASSDSIADQTSGNYSCVADNVVNELNEQYGGDDWQCIVGSNANELTAKIDYIGGTLFDALFSHTHRIIVYRINNAKQISNKKVMLTARRAAQFNRTLVIANYASDDTPVKLITDAVYHYSTFQLLCDYLVAAFGKRYRNTNWACVAGRDGQFAGALSRKENLVAITMDYLKVMLVQRN